MSCSEMSLCNSFDRVAGFSMWRTRNGRWYPGVRGWTRPEELPFQRGWVGGNQWFYSSQVLFQMSNRSHVQMSSCWTQCLWLLREEVWKSNINLRVISIFAEFEFQEERVCQERVESWQGEDHRPKGNK